MKKSIPIWINIVASLLTLLGLLVGSSLYISPGTFIPDIDFTANDVNFLKNMWAARQIAIASIIGYSLIRQSREMMTVSLIAYCLMNLQDVMIGISKEDPGLAIGAACFSALSGIMIFYLRGKQTVQQ